MKLSELNKGCKAVITENLFSGSMRRRIKDLGFSEGSEIECMGSSLFGSPKAYLIKGSVFALRNSDADRILVEHISK